MVRPSLMHWQLLVVLVLAVARPSNGSSQDLWEEIQHPSSPALTPTYVSLHSPLVALEQPEKGSTQQKMGLDHAKFDAIQSKIRGGSKHIKLIGTGVENGLELEVSPFNVFTDDVVIETDDSVGSMKLPEMLFLRGKVVCFYAAATKLSGRFLPGCWRCRLVRDASHREAR